jgi:hypothetical protein
MKNDNIFNSLIAKARNEEPPRVDIAERVIAILAADEKQLERFWNRPLMWIAAFSSAAAASVSVLAALLHHMWVGPLYEISEVISWVM